MNFQQLRIVRETVRQDFNLTEVASVLFTSQPGVSKHIRDLEEELGVDIFVRRGKRLLGLTEPGEEALQIVDRILFDVQNLRRISDRFSEGEAGDFVVATTHTQARYALPEIIKWFKADYPKVHLTLLQGSPREIAQLVLDGVADVGIATEAVSAATELASFPYYSWHHAIVVPEGHPLLSEEKITIKTLSSYPIVTYHEGFTGRASVNAAFLHAGITPDIVLSAIDADVIKTYVGLGLGVGIMASVAYDSKQDRHLSMIPVPHLFPINTTYVAIRKGNYFRDYVYAFIEKICPDVGDKAIRMAADKNI
jgi:LysR family transcriptional regulator, cys regulon transcriptional activator